MLVRIFIISSMDVRYSLKFWSTIWLICSRFNQYFVSLASLLAIAIFEMKSFFVWAAVASSMFAPIEVPDRSNCFDIMNSFFVAKSRYNVMIDSANWKDFFLIMLSFTLNNVEFWILNFKEFWILNFEFWMKTKEKTRERQGIFGKILV